MTNPTDIIVYVFLFVSLYFEVFMLITYFENKLDIQEETKKAKQKIKKYLSVSMIVPCWNEEKTVSKTIHSLLDLDYPKDKLKIIIIDDGSTDKTWEVIQKFKNKEQVEMYRKTNGGKHTALNFGLSKSTSDLVGCLDADSYVDKDMLRNLVTYFSDKEIMAVTPSVKVWKPKTIIQMMQKVEYGWGIFIRKMLSYIDAIYVTPGPGTLFRKEVFDNLGGYRHAHLVEDMELAMRMQTNQYKIRNSHDAYVYTVAPDTVRKMYKQKLRWTYGFIKNVIDYRFVFFKRKYGNLGMFILPIASFSVLSAIYVGVAIVVNAIQSLIREAIKIQTVGVNFRWDGFTIDWFSINTEYIAILSLIAFFGMLCIVFISRKLAEGKIDFGMDLIYFLALYSFIAPVWTAKALYNALFSVKTYWR